MNIEVAKSKILDRIYLELNVMQGWLFHADITVKTQEKVLKRIHLHHINTLKEGLLFIKKLKKSPEYLEFISIRNEGTETFWINASLYGRDLNEYQVLIQKRKALKAAWSVQENFLYTFNRRVGN